jgi:hypothetical protein
MTTATRTTTMARRADARLAVRSGDGFSVPAVLLIGLEREDLAVPANYIGRETGVMIGHLPMTFI